MMRQMKSSSVILAVLFAFGCGSDSSNATPDSGTPQDTGTASPDSTEDDGWVWPDTGDPDQGQPDPDQGQPDPDQGQPDPDQGQPDTDQGQPDPDQGQPDPDQGIDQGPDPDSGVDAAVDTGPSPDLTTIDASGMDAGPAVTCASATGVLLQEVAVGSTDYVAIRNTGTTAVSVVGYSVDMYGISSTPTTYTILAGDVSGDLGPGEWLYLFEYSKGEADDISTGDNIPFYNGPPNATKPDAVLLYDASGDLLDYFAVGDTVGIPANVSFSPLGWPSTFDSSNDSFQRTATQGSCPNFEASDWGASSLTRRL